MSNETFPKGAEKLLDYLEGRMNSGYANTEAEDTLQGMIGDCKRWEADDLIENGSIMDQLSYVFNTLGRAEFLGQLETHFVDACQTFQFPATFSPHGLGIGLGTDLNIYKYGLEGFEEYEEVQPETLTPLIQNMIQACGCTPDPEAPLWGLTGKETFILSSEGRLALIGKKSGTHIRVIVESP